MRWKANAALGTEVEVLRCGIQALHASPSAPSGPFAGASSQGDDPARHTPRPISCFPAPEGPPLLFCLPKSKSFLKVKLIFAAKVCLSKTTSAGIFYSSWNFITILAIIMCFSAKSSEGQFANPESHLSVRLTACC